MINSIHPFQEDARSPFGAIPKLFVFLNLIFFTLGFDNSSQSQTPVTFTSSTSWTCPTGVTSITVECWGAGGGGGTRSTNGGGGGGGAGAYAKSSLTVIPGNSYAISVGSGGPAGTAGGPSSFGGSTVVAAGGLGVASNTTTGGAGGTIASSTGDIRYSGGNGGTGASGNGGGGGGAAGRDGNGANGSTSNQNGGAGNGLYSGSGPNGPTGSNTAGTNGNIYGSGGSGARKTSSGTLTGGTGAQGLVLVTINDALWQNPIIETGLTASPYTTGDLVTSNVTVSGITRGAGLTSSSANDIYNATGWTTTNTVASAISSNDYFEFTLTPASGYWINFTGFTYTGQVSTGTPSHALRSSLDGYASNIGTATTTGTSISLSASTFQNVYQPVTFRFYTFGVANGTTTQYSINDFAFSGAVVQIPNALWANQITGTAITASPYTTGNYNAANVTVSGITRGAGLTSSSANDIYNATGWTTNNTVASAISSNDYFEFTLTPASGYWINFTGFTYAGRVSTGTPGHALRSSLDGYASNIGTATTTGTSISLTADLFQNVFEPVTFRFYTFGVANNSTTQYSINDFIFFGTLETMPSLWQNSITGTNPNLSNPYTSGQTHGSQITVSGISRGAGIAGINTNDRYNANGWSTSTTLNTANNDYYEFTLTPNSAKAINFIAFTFTGQRNNASSPEDFAVRSSLDSYTANIWSVDGNTSTSASNVLISLEGSSYQNIYSAITFRIYGWDSGSETYQFSVNDFAFYGTIRNLVPPTLSSFLPTAACPNSEESIVITGTYFELVTSVKVNGVDAAYTVNSTTQITATLPNSATTGIISVTTAGGTANSSTNFTVYEGSGDVTLLSANFDDNNISAWTSPTGGWSATNSSPISGTRSLTATSGGIFSQPERSISTPLAGAPVNLNSAAITWRFQALPSGTTDEVYIWLTSNSSDPHVNSVYGYYVVFTGSQINFGLKQGATTTNLITYSAGFALTGVEVTRSAGGSWEFRTDANGGFDNLVLRGTVNNTTITTASYFGVFMENPFGSGLVLKLDDVEITQEGKCHVVYYSQASGNFSDPIWSRERVSTGISASGDDITSFVIQNAHTVTTSAAQTTKHTTIEAGGTLAFSGTNVLTLHRDLINQGTISSGSGTIRFSGSVAQAYTSTTDQTLNNVIINNTGNTVSFPSGVVTTIKANATVTIPSGTLNTGNNLVLRSTSVGTASIGTIASGATLTGQVTMQRHMPALTGPAPVSGNGSWIAMGTPITGATLQQWNETITTTGFTGSDYPAPAYTFNNIQWYDQSAAGAIDQGYTPATNITNSLSAKRGYFVYLMAASQAVRVKGNIQQGTFNDTVYYTNNGIPTADGWNLLVNRYPSEVDFKSMAESGAGGITSYHLFNAETNNYKVYHTNATGTAPRYIASSQGFFVKASAANSYLRYQESFKTNQGTAFERDLQESSFAAIKFYKAQNNEDECVLNFNDNATANFENEYDAIKLHSQEPTVAECALVSADGQLMSIDSRPLGQDAAIAIPIYVEMPVSGTYRLRIEQINNLPFGSCLFVEDLVTGNTMPFEVGQELVVVHTGNYSGNRFLIHASPSVAIVETHADCFGTSTGAIQLTVPQGEWTLSLADTLGNSYAMSETAGTFENLPAGQYIASAANALSNCPVSNKTITITEPAEMVLTHLSSSVDNCNASGNAAIEWIVSNATNYDYAVVNQANEIVSSGNTGSGAVLVDGLNAGIYVVSIETYCGTQSFETNLNDTNTVSTQILSEDILLSLAEGTSQTLSVEQSSVNTTNYTWLLSNGNISESETFSYEFDQPGNFLLKLYAYNDQCVAQDSIAIFVDQVVSISEDGTPAPISFFQTKDSFELYLNLSSQERTRVSVIDLSGREVWAMNTSTQPGKNISIGTGAFASGVYFLRTTVGNEEILNKKFINP